MVQVSSQLEDMARDMVGDNGSPNLYFVSIHGPGEPRTGIFLVTSDFDVAYDAWRKLPRDTETALEDRQTGTIASTEPESDKRGARFVTYDVSAQLRSVMSERRYGTMRRPEVRVRSYPRKVR